MNKMLAGSRRRRENSPPLVCSVWLSNCVAVIVLMIATTGPLMASPTIADTCNIAAHRAAQKTGVPLSVLMAITLTETGRRSGGKFRPWPWTVNMEGKGVWFDSEDEARAYAYKHFQRGARSFDVGCFQLNFKWHGKAFRSIEEMFDPQTNANYAAEFLRNLFYETGSWDSAAGAYHSRTPKYADRYKKRFQSIRASLKDVDGQDAGPLPAPLRTPNDNVDPDQSRINRFPLLLASNAESSRLGSLVPVSAGVGGLRLIDVDGN